jgi:PHD/YefM family antitoxin component YafN of YafNO toxin-antitoxin module
MLIKGPDAQPIFWNYIKNIVGNILTTSDLCILKRLAAVENRVGLNDYSDLDDEEHELTNPEQLTLLAERIDNVTEPIQREYIPNRFQY